MTPSYVRPAFVEYVCDRYVRRVAVTGSAMPDRSNEFSRRALRSRRGSGASGRGISEMGKAFIPAR